ncbi:MAG TPA: hypothetical protein VFO37_12585, partial [Chitinophagaceae bacterium]|nr:hypothetical protein [Chitinophagaceae bacterium]
MVNSHQIWGAKRKNPIVLQRAVEDIKERFKDTEGNFENKLPVVIVIFRNSESDGVNEPGVCKEEELEEIRNMGIARIVAVNNSRLKSKALWYTYCAHIRPVYS